MPELRLIARCVLMLATTAAGVDAMAQANVPSSAASAAAERAQKETDRTMYWIRVMAEKPVARPAAPKPVAAATAPAPAPQPRTAAAPAEPRVKVASATAPPSTGTANAASPVVAPAAPAVAAPALPVVSGAGSAGNGSAAASGGLEAAVSAAGLAGSLAAPTLTPAPIEAAPEEAEEPDPGLVIIKSVEPEVPHTMLVRKRSGEVEVKFEVGADGVVETVSVMKSTQPGLNEAAMDAVRQWRFKPTPRGHTALVNFVFNLGG